MDKTVLYIKWNDACEADTFDEVNMKDCIQETVGFFVKISDGNFYIARDWNTLEEGHFLKVIRIPEEYIIEKKVLDL